MLGTVSLPRYMCSPANDRSFVALNPCCIVILHNLWTLTMISHLPALGRTPKSLRRSSILRETIPKTPVYNDSSDATSDNDFRLTLLFRDDLWGAKPSSDCSSSSGDLVCPSPESLLSESLRNPHCNLNGQTSTTILRSHQSTWATKGKEMTSRSRWAISRTIISRHQSNDHCSQHRWPRSPTTPLCPS